MNKQISGKILSTQLGSFGPNETKYGYISIQNNDNTIFKIKIDAYTMYETLEIGDQVHIEAEFLGDTNILVARKIHLDEGDLTHQTETAKAAT